MKRPERTEREAAALRANLLKRKDQARRRAVADDTTAEPARNQDPAPQTDKGGQVPPALKQ